MCTEFQRHQTEPASHFEILYLLGESKRSFFQNNFVVNEEIQLETAIAFLYFSTPSHTFWWVGGVQRMLILARKLQAGTLGSIQNVFFEVGRYRDLEPEFHPKKLE